MPGRAFIYALADPDTGAVRYIGKADDPQARLVRHLRDHSGVRKARWLRSLDAPPQLLILEEIAVGGDWQEAERRWIARFRAEGTDLTNHTDGGEGLAGASAETRAKLSVIAKAKMADPDFRARIFTPERAARISVALTGRPKSPEHVAKMAASQRGRKLSPEVAEAKRVLLREYGFRWPKGVPIPVETRAKIADGLRGNQHTKGRVIPLDERRLRSQTTQARPKPPEHRERIASAMVDAWAIGRRAAVQGDRVAWPPWAEIETALASETIAEVAKRLGVKRGTLSAHIMRRRRGAPEQRKAAA